MNLRKLIFTNNACYKSGRKIAVKGIMVHSTGANNPKLSRYVGPDDGLLGKNKHDNHWNQDKPDGRQVCVHGFIGRLADGSIATWITRLLRRFRFMVGAAPGDLGLNLGKGFFVYNWAVAVGNVKLRQLADIANLALCDVIGYKTFLQQHIALIFFISEHPGQPGSAEFDALLAVFFDDGYESHAIKIIFKNGLNQRRLFGYNGQNTVHQMITQHGHAADPAFFKILADAPLDVFGHRP